MRNRCDKCNQAFVINGTIKQDIQMFKCGHNFHNLCLKQARDTSKPGNPAPESVNCLLCFNEHDHIQQIIMSRQKSSKGVGVRGNHRGQAAPPRTASTTASDDDALSRRGSEEGLTEEHTSASGISLGGYQETSSSEFERYERKLLRYEYAVGQREMFLQHYM